MIRTFLLTVAAASLSTSTVPGANEADGATAAAVQADELPIEWTIRRADRRDGNIQLRLDVERPGHHSSNERGVPLAELIGLSADQLAGNGPVAFQLRAEAGTIDCRGTADGGRGIGSCDFLPDRSFADELVRRGFQRPTTEQQYQLAVHRVGRALLAELDQHGYRADLRDLIAAGIHGVTADYVRGLAGAGYRLGEVDKLVEFRIHGVTVDYLRALAVANPNLARLPADQLVAMRIHGVSPELVRSLAAAGFGDLPPARIVELRIHGATPEFIRGMAGAGYRNLSASQLVAMRIHGVSPEFVRELAALGYRDVSASDLVAMRIHGVTPDWVRGLHAAGIRPADADELVQERILGRRSAGLRHRRRD